MGRGESNHLLTGRRKSTDLSHKWDFLQVGERVIFHITQELVDDLPAGDPLSEDPNEVADVKVKDKLQSLLNSGITQLEVEVAWVAHPLRLSDRDFTFVSVKHDAVGDDFHVYPSDLTPVKAAE